MNREGGSIAGSALRNRRGVPASAAVAKAAMKNRWMNGVVFMVLIGLGLIGFEIRFGLVRPVFGW